MIHQPIITLLRILHVESKKLLRPQPVIALLSGAAYRLPGMTEEVSEMDKSAMAKLFRPEIIHLINEIIKTGSVSILDELIQLTPSGLFEMMRIRGLGGKKLSILWKNAKIDI